jgi:aldose 1-epimerase
MENIQLYTLINGNGVKAIITNYGARLVSLITPDSNGVLRDVVLGYDNIDDIVNGNQYFGSTIGRFANRIAEGKFSVDGVEYTLLKNNGENALHGGAQGYDTTVWTAVQEDNKVILRHTDKDMHEGYPGNVKVKVTYELTEGNELKISYEAETDKATPFNITNHAFFNLRGAGNGNILDHKFLINADKITPINKNQIPTGEIVDVKDTPFDFTELTEIGKNIDADDEVLANGYGYDHNWVINGEEDELKFCAEVVEPEFGVVMEVFTTEPGVQLYTGNFLDKSDVGREGVGYGRREAFCLETQHFPDSPNKPHFPSTILKPADKFVSQSVYKFGTK